MDLLCDVAGQCGISFDVEDETDYYEHQDFSRMCREHFMPWLGRIVDLLEEKSGKDYGNMLVSYDMSWPVPENITGSYVTPFGRYRTARILGIKNSKGQPRPSNQSYYRLQTARSYPEAGMWHCRYGKKPIRSISSRYSHWRQLTVNLLMRLWQMLRLLQSDLRRRKRIYSK